VSPAPRPAPTRAPIVGAAAWWRWAAQGLRGVPAPPKPAKPVEPVKGQLPLPLDL
jgi:hypothetical protein